MALVVPNPTVPTNGQALDASPLLANLNAVYQAIQSFDAGQISAGTLVANAFNASINPNTFQKENLFPFVASGVIWSTVSGLNATMTSGVIYVNGIRVVVTSVASQAMAASKDTYIDVDVNGNITYNAVTTGAAAPALTANSVRVAKVIAGASITSILTTGMDSLKNLIYPQTFTKAAAADANGWIRRNYGAWNTYEFVQTVTAQTVPANSNLNVATVNMPIGIIDTSYLRFTYSTMGGFGGRIFSNGDNGNTTAPTSNFGLQLGNLTTAGISYTGFVYVFAITI